MQDIEEKKAWGYDDCGEFQQVQVDSVFNMAYIKGERVTVLIDYGTVSIGL